jgi:periplasmic protein TonB
MFETVAPEAFQKRSRGVFFKTLPLSIAVHLIAIAAVMAGMFWRVVFPTQSPKMFAVYSLTQIPDPPPPPPPPPKPAEPARPTPEDIKLAPPPPPAAPAQIVAPTIIPDTIPEVAPPQPAPPPPPVAAPAVAKSSENGMAGGRPGGTGRTLGGTGITLGDDGRVYVDRKVKVPMKEIDHDLPHYPDAAKKIKAEGTCVVRYTVGKNGRVTDIVILKHADYPMFDEETLNTVRAWRYQPMTIDGKPVEVIHEIEVNYEFTVR